MLILTRRAGETIVIGDNIFVTVLKSKCISQVRLAITAPEHISIHRKEIYTRIMRENHGIIIPKLSIER